MLDFDHDPALRRQSRPPHRAPVCELGADRDEYRRLSAVPVRPHAPRCPRRYELPDLELRHDSGGPVPAGLPAAGDRHDSRVADAVDLDIPAWLLDASGGQYAVPLGFRGQYRG